jgi:hypothetical protein
MAAVTRLAYGAFGFSAISFNVAIANFEYRRANWSNASALFGLPPGLALRPKSAALLALDHAHTPSSQTAAPVRLPQKPAGDLLFGA